MKKNISITILLFFFIISNCFAINDDFKPFSNTGIYLYADMNNEEAATWAVYAYSLNKWDKEHPEKRCNFEREFYARNQAIAFVKEKRKSDTKGFDIQDKQIIAMELAYDQNLLSEFAWHYFDNSNCEKPNELNLEIFNKWKEKNLTDFKPEVRAYFEAQKVTNQPEPKKIKNKQISEKAANQSIAGSDLEEKYGKLVKEGYNKLISRHAKESIDKYFNPTIEAFNSYYGSKQVYCARVRAEALFYLLKSAEKKEEAEVLPQLWADAFYFKGCASVELGKIEDAKTFIKKALELSPSNSMYLSELGHIYQVERKLVEAMELFKKAEESANAYSPENVKNTELTRAMRGVGYSLIELGRLDEAEEKYKKCLKINKDDKKALGELGYIKSLKNKNNP